MIEIGNDVCFTRGCTILTHGFDWFVLRNLHDEVIASSGKVSIGNNVFMGIGTTILKGVTIGDNCIIGACSLVNKDVPANSVAAGNPARVVCGIEEYYQKRKSKYVEEAKAYARSIKERFGRTPIPADFWEEFPLFLKAEEVLQGSPFSVQDQLGPSYEKYLKSHHPCYDSYQAFLKDAGII
ncbi:MAG TPA: acyltransferase [Thermoguttaceae bacterium]|nr:acyltransferase [Thermoguttaceae bacterium]